MLTSADQTVSLNQHLQGQIVGFIGAARAQQFRLGVQETLDAQRLAATIGITHKQQLRCSLKTLLCASPDDWERFDEVFDRYWHRHEPRQSTFATVGGKSPRQAAPAQIGSAGKGNAGNDSVFDVPNPDALDGDGTGDNTLSQRGASAQQSISDMRFDQLEDPQALRHMEWLAGQLAQRIRRVLLRRLRSDQHGQRIDIRRTLRNNQRYGGEPLALHYRKRRQHIPKLVLLLDVSRSMSVYSNLFLRFARGILGAFRQADAFAFHTHLVHIGEALREPSRRKLAEKMALISAGWGGGTRIDRSLASFNRDYGRILNGRSIVIIVSDGYDTGDPAVLAEQLRRIKRRIRRLIWLNPLLGLQNYTPESRCIQAALPFIDVFAPAHNLQSLAALETHLARR